MIIGETFRLFLRERVFQEWSDDFADFQGQVEEGAIVAGLDDLDGGFEGVEGDRELFVLATEFLPALATEAIGTSFSSASVSSTSFSTTLVVRHFCRAIITSYIN